MLIKNHTLDSVHTKCERGENKMRELDVSKPKHENTK